MFNELYAKASHPVLVQLLGGTITANFTYDQAAADHIGRPVTRVVSKTLTIKFEPLKLELVSTGGTHGSKHLTIETRGSHFWMRAQYAKPVSSS